MRRRSRFLHRLIQVTAVAAFLLLVAGGLVTSMDAGLSVPDWPLSYGTWLPPMVGGIRYEHGHRMIAALVGVLILIMAVWLWRVEPRRWVRRLGAAALGAVVAQALLGGLTVLLRLPPPVSIAHACLGPTVFCLLVCLAQATAPSWIELPPPWHNPSAVAIRRVSVSLAGLTGVQLFLGAILRHTGQGLAWHLGGAVLLTGGAAWLIATAHRVQVVPPSLRAFAHRLGVLLGLQLLLGWLAFQRPHAAWLVTAHVAMGSLVLAQAVLLGWHAHRLAPLRSVRHFFRTPRFAKCLTLFELTKPRLTTLVLATTAAGFWLGLRPPHAVARLIPLLVGTGLVVGGANALNQWMERDLDGLMQRTKDRPLPSGRLRPEAARRFGLALVALGVVLLATVVNGLTAALALLSAASYLFLYTPMKRWTPLCTLIGAIPGALPPLIGWVGARGQLGLESSVLFTILFVWQLPHFLAIAWLYRDDYARAAFRFLPVLDPSGMSTSRQLLWYATALLAVSLFPTIVGLAGSRYFIGALVLGCAFLWVSLLAALGRTAASARRLFVSSVSYLPLLLSLMVADKLPA